MTIKGKLLPLRQAQSVPLSDEALVAACAVGDSAALAQLFDRHEEVVRRFVSRLQGADRADVGDLVQTTFLEVFRAASRFGGRAAVRTWILAIAANAVRHHVRTEVRRRRMISVFAEQPEPIAATGLQETIERRELLARLGEALKGLSHDLREAFVLCDLEEISGAEAARALGVREGTLYWRLHEARKALRASLDAGRGT
jgi:RNA polymerase sigma-70 factor (ECF subfamily)